jgi:2-polyprenyl-3-methyl-5-hydroxy-6-metoxy-1,4-benzoquinol methylase
MMRWKKVWAEFPASFEETEFYRQVGKTVLGKPISPEQFEAILADVSNALEMNKEVTLLDLCCGNGIITAKMAEKCARVVGVDYSEPLIRIARKYCQPQNTIYFQMSVLDKGIRTALDRNQPFTRILMYEALQHFDEADLSPILDTLRQLSTPDVVILLGSVPDKERLWNFYNTEERREIYRVAKSRNEEAIGTWWEKKNIVDVCNQKGFDVQFLEQNPILHTAHYRMDVRLVKSSAR